MAVKQIFDSFIPSESVISNKSEGRRKEKKKRRAVTSVVSHRAEGKEKKEIEGKT